MKIFNLIYSSLSTPDSQDRDWYGWSSNQCSHALFGVIVAMLFPTAVLQMVLIVALLKETFDFIKIMTFKTFKDSIVDIWFWLIGGFLFINQENPIPTIIIFIFSLLMGIIPRARKLLAAQAT